MRTPEMTELPRNESYLTEPVPGTGGSLRTENDDFRVEEIPLKPPEGLGDHLYLRLEKSGVPTLEAVRAVARLVGVDEKDIGYAGLKDAHAVTLQWMSVLAPGSSAERKLVSPRLPEGLRITEVKRGRAKLRRGELLGNRFEIRIRGVSPGAADRAHETLATLAERGVPNAFGEQRFGVRGNSAELGRALVLEDWSGAVAHLLGPSRMKAPVEGGDGAEGGSGHEKGGKSAESARRFVAGDLAGALRLYPEAWRAERHVLSALMAGAAPEKALKAIPRRERILFASALQAAIFNTCLARRLDGGACDRLLSGDVLFSHRSGKTRRVGDPEKEAAALARFDVSPAGPLVGEKMLETRGEPGEMEGDALRGLGLDPGELNKGLARMGVRGGRRPYRARLQVREILAEEGDLRLRFELPPGAYATEVLREVMKVELPREAGYYLRETIHREPTRIIDCGGT